MQLLTNLSLKNQIQESVKEIFKLSTHNTIIKLELSL